MRLRIALAAALLLVAGALAFEMSRTAPRIAGMNHAVPSGFYAVLPKGGVVCQPGGLLPQDAHRVRMLVNSYGHRLPSLSVTFTTAAGNTSTRGRLPVGAAPGYVTIPLRYPHGATAAGSLCIHAPSGSDPIAFSGETPPPNPGSATVNGTHKAANIALTYLRGGRESWWQLLPTLQHRFGLGKASFFGSWTLPLAAALMLAIWITAAFVLRSSF